MNIYRNTYENSQNQNLEIIAEHVENEKAARYLADIGVEYLQGYLFS